MTPHHSLQKYMRFSRTMREAYGYDARLERTPAPFKSHWPFVLPAALGCLLLFGVMVML